ncbi:c-type cytochrome [Paraburkholderia sp. GAS448]|jgi:cytochrome c|uniref:c-type cytochrome n=1 Tax=Paraburkholderia sp. GAS448 TaxID=3035136 RepID=UPI003D22A5BF
MIVCPSWGARRASFGPQATRAGGWCTHVDRVDHCMFCHTTDAPFLAPSFQQIAERYRKVPNARLMLENKLRLGGKAHWGDTAMPLPADRGGPITPEDAHTLIVWVLSQ